MGKKIRAIYPGTFDPLTNGHLDIIQRAASIFDEVIVAVVKHSSKETLFSYQKRIIMIKESIKGIKGVSLEGFDGLVVDFARKKNVKVIVRGLRMISDFEYEFQMALTNRNLTSQIETMFLMPHPQYSYISSRLIKEAASLGADLKVFLPKVVLSELKRKFNENKCTKNKRSRPRAD